MRQRFNQWLLFSFFFIGLMLGVRIYLTGGPGYIFLIWNLFLAWIPYLLSNLLFKSKQKPVLIQSFLFISWLLFFPNALYVITDLIHLQEREGLPLWFDAVLLFIASFTGLSLAFASLRNVELYITRLKLPVNRSIAMIVLLFAGSFGVYLGRFQRWNSWNIVSSPLDLFTDIIVRCIHPFQHIHTWTVVIFFTAVYSLCWFFTKIFWHVPRTPRKIKQPFPRLKAG